MAVLVGEAIVQVDACGAEDFVAFVCGTLAVEMGTRTGMAVVAAEELGTDESGAQCGSGGDDAEDSHGFRLEVLRAEHTRER